MINGLTWAVYLAYNPRNWDSEYPVLKLEVKELERKVFTFFKLYIQTELTSDMRSIHTLIGADNQTGFV